MERAERADREFRELQLRSLDLPKHEMDGFLDELFVFSIRNDMEEMPPTPDAA